MIFRNKLQFSYSKTLWRFAQWEIKCSKNQLPECEKYWCWLLWTRCSPRYGLEKWKKCGMRYYKGVFYMLRGNSDKLNFLKVIRALISKLDNTVSTFCKALGERDFKMKTFFWLSLKKCIIFQAEKKGSSHLWMPISFFLLLLFAPELWVILYLTDSSHVTILFFS